MHNMFFIKKRDNLNKVWTITVKIHNKAKKKKKPRAELTTKESQGLGYPECLESWHAATIVPPPK